MNAQPPSSVWERSTFIRFFRWLASGHGILRVLIVLAWTVSILALLYGGEHWLARHAWTDYRQKLVARGEQLDLKSFIPKPVPDDENFAATPFVKSWFEKGPGNEQWSARDNYSKILGNVPSLRKDSDRGERRFINLVACAEAFDALEAGRLDRRQEFDSGKLDLNSRAAAAPAVLKGLSDDEAYFAEVRAASQRPYSRYPVVYNLDNPWGILLPHEQNLRDLCSRLRLKACAELAAGQSNQALADVRLMLYLGDSLKEDPFLISYLVRAACVAIATQPIWEGLAEHAWSDAQLQELQTRLEQYNFVADLKRPLGAEQAAGILTVNLTRKHGVLYWNQISNPDSSSPSSRWFATLINLSIPSGWYYREELNYSRLFHTLLGPELDSTPTQIAPDQVRSRTLEFDQELGSSGFSRFVHHRLIAALLLPALQRIPIRAAVAQTRVNQACLACALERYRLANGQFPEKLEALAPRFISQLPKDVLTGEPYKYRRTDDGRFVLYSTGWDGKDDGGTPGKTLFDEKNGDWVWQYPGGG